MEKKNLILENFSKRLTFSILQKRFCDIKTLIHLNIMYGGYVWSFVQTWDAG